ncbi:DUF3857 domain-containing protein [Penaeicola halotolerans]|uniref:DUF3857 domain-containing protein n=1 Tax=Penaeicola halotolerans TaxID=2793196 RepID=UPI001CF91DBE|nr:DUF3857 domain-containing protein [Penaeicola halotolerans]
MKTLTTKLVMILVAFIISINLIKAQGLKWGKISQEEIDYKTVDFEPDAGAVVLAEQGVTSIISGKVLTDYHFRKKVLSENGKDIGDVVISYNSGSRKINGLKAHIITFEGGKENVIELKKKDFFETEVGDGFKEIRFTFPNVNPGAIIEYTYKEVSDNLTFINGWTFQNDIPTLRSTYEFQRDQNLDYRVSFQGYNLAVSGQMQKKESKWELTNLPSMKPEPYMNNFRDYLDVIKFQLAGYTTVVGGNSYESPLEYKSFIATWDQLAKELLSIDTYDSYVGNNSVTRSLAKDLVLEGESTYEKMKFAHKYVLENFEFDGDEGIIPSRRLKDVLEAKRGSQVELNMVLVAILKAHGITSSPVLISSKGNGSSVLSTYPFINQFDALILTAVHDGDFIFFDTTDDDLPFGSIPLKYAVEKGFIMRDQNSILLDINTQVRSGRASMNQISFEDGKEKHDNLLRLSGYDGFIAMKRMKKVTDEELQKEVMSEENKNTATNFIASKNQVNENTFDLKWSFSKEFEGDDIVYVNPFEDEKWDENPFKNDTRLFPVDFNYLMSDTYTSIIKIPDGYELDDYPENQAIKIVDNLGTFYYQVSELDGTVTVSAKVIFNAIIFPPAYYPYLKSFLDNVVSKLKEPLVFKKLANP